MQQVVACVTPTLAITVRRRRKAAAAYVRQPQSNCRSGSDPLATVSLTLSSHMAVTSA